MLVKVLSGIAILLLGGLSLLVPSGYLVPVTTLLFTLPLCWLASVPGTVRPGELWPVLVVMLVGIVWLLMAAWHGETEAALPLVWPALLCVPLFWPVRRATPSLRWLWSGLVLGGIGAGTWALIQVYGLGVRRAAGHDPLHPILFGNLALMTGLFCLAGLGWAVRHRRRLCWMIPLSIGATGGLVASLLSGTRGGWVVLPALLALLFFVHGRALSRRVQWLLVVGTLAFASLAVAVPQTGVQARLAQGLDHVSRYLGGERTVRTGARLEIWHTAIQLISQRPLSGWGDQGYRQGVVRLVTEGRAASGVTRYTHAHNDLLDAWVRRGAPGALSLLLMYALPVGLFWKGLGSTSSSRRALATCGVLLATGYFGFGLSYSFMVYPAGLALYTLWFSVLWALYQSAGQRGPSTS